MRDANAYGRYERGGAAAMRRVWTLVVLLALAAGLFAFVFGVTLVRDGDMDPEWREGRPVFFLRLGGVRRGDVVVLRVDVRGTVLRRVVAVPGDTVELRDGTLFVNGLAERGSYSITRTDPVPDGQRYPLILRRDEYFVLGDRRETALDSRSFGPVTMRNILGRVP